MAEIKIKLGVGNDNFNVDKHFINEFSSLSQSSSSPADLQYGVVPNSGSVTIVDASNTILKEIQNSQSSDTISATVLMNTTTNPQQVHVVKDSNYDISDNKLMLSLTNDLDFWNQELDTIYMITNGERDLSATSLYNLTVRLFSVVGISNVDSMMTDKIIRGADNALYTIKQYLQSITVGYPYLKKDTLRNNIDKICQVAQLNFIADDNGSYKFVDNRTVVPYDVDVVKIDDGNIFTDLSYDPLSKKYIETISVNSNTSYLNFINIKDIGFTFYQQANNSRLATVYYSGGEISRMLYGNNWNDYITNNTTSDSTTSFITYNSSTLKTILKTTVSIDKISDLIRWKICYNNLNINYYNESYNLDSTSNNKPVLFNANFNDYSAGFTYYYSHFEDNETDAINYLNSASPNNAELCLVKQNENQYVLYAVITKGTTFAQQPSSYYGEIRAIYLDGTISILLESVDEVSNDISYDGDIQLTSNEIMQTNTIYDESDIFTIQSQNILSDFSNGVLTGTIIVSCSNYYDENGNLVYNWNNGQVLKVGDVISINNDVDESGNQRYWKITGRNIKYDAVPLLDLELLEIKQINYMLLAGLYDDDMNLLYDWDYLVNNGYIELYDNGTIDVSGLTHYDVSATKEQTGGGIIPQYRCIIEDLNGSMLVIPKKVGNNYIIDGLDTEAFAKWTGLKNIMVQKDSNVSDQLLIKPHIDIGTEDIYETIDISGNYMPFHIGTKAFYGCTSLDNIKVNGNIGNNAFSGCVSLSYVNVINGNIDSYAFVDCENLKTAIMPRTTWRVEFQGTELNGSFVYVKNTRTIGEGAFAGCVLLESITFNDNILSIGGNAFSNCSAMHNIYIPSSVTTINASSASQSPFTGCPSTALIYCGAGSKPNGWGAYWNYYNNNSKLTTYWGFSIDGYELAINNPDFIFSNTVVSGYVGEGGDVTIPYGTTQIGSVAFMDKSSITSIIIPDSVVKISSLAFYNCTGLISVEMPNSITSTDPQIFYRCTSLLEIKLSNSLSFVNYELCYECVSLQYAYVGKNVDGFGVRAFYGCSSLRGITIEAITPPTLSNGVFENTNNNFLIYVPSSSVDAYKSAWTEYADRIYAKQ